MVRFEFDKETTLTAIELIKRNIPNITRHGVAKLLYFADKMHLEKYGTPITGDIYLAMDYGPVPQHVYSWIQENAGNKGRSVPSAAFDMGNLSESELKVLGQVINRYKKEWADFSERTSASHDAAWHKARRRNPSSRGPTMRWDDIIDTLPNAEDVKRYLRYID